MALSDIRQVGDGYNEALVLTSMGEAELQIGNAAAAITHLRQARLLMKVEQVPVRVAAIAVLLATAAERIGDFRAAREHLLVAAEIYEALGAPEHAALMRQREALPDQPAS